MKKELNISEHRILIYEPDKAGKYSILYLHANDETESDNIWELLGKKGFVLACIQNTDWDRDMSPWPASKAFKGGEDFAGKADDYLSILTQKIVPEVEKNICFELTDRGLIGYSLSGLFALYALYKTDIFSMIGCMSGSLWYDGWLSFMQSAVPKINSPKVYLSLGDKEKSTRNERMSTIESCMNRAEEILNANGATTIFEMNPGNHFNEIPERIAKGIKWLI